MKYVLARPVSGAVVWTDLSARQFRRGATGTKHKGGVVMFAKCTAGMAGILALMVLLLVLGPSYAQPSASQQGWPINHPASSASFPWNSPGYQGYNEPSYARQPIYPSAPMVQPEKYEVNVNALPMENTVDPNVVTLVAHVPDNAQVWVEDTPTASRGTLRTYQSPRLAAGKS